MNLKPSNTFKVLVIYKGPYPIGPVYTHRVHHICKGLVENGVEVELLVPIPTENYKNVINTQTSGIHEGVHFKYISKQTQRRKNLFLQHFNDFWYQVKTIFYTIMNRGKANVTIIIGPSFDFRLLLPIVIKLTKSKTVLEINEYPFVNHKSNLLLKIKSFIFLKIIIPFYDGFIVISEELANFLIKFKSKRATIIKVPILGSVDSYSNSKYPPLDTPYIMHAGSLLERKDGILGMIEAFGIASSKLDFPVKLVFTGFLEFSPDAEAIKQLIKKYAINEKIIFTGYLSRSDLIYYLRNCSLAIINKNDNKQNRYCFATKLADYLFNAIPVIITDVGEASNYLSDGINAYIVKPGDPNLIAEKIIKALTCPDERIKIGLAGRILAEREFNYRTQARYIVNYFNNLCTVS